MKKVATLLASATLLLAVQSTSLTAAPLVSIGDTVDIFFRGALAGQYRSNVFNSPQKRDDYVGVVSPGLEVNIGRNSNANIKIMFREDLYYYNEYTSQNTQRANVNVTGVYNSGPLTSSAGFTFLQTQQNTASIAGTAGGTAFNQVETNHYSGYVKADYDISPKTWVKGSVSVSTVDYTNNSDFNDAYSNNVIYTVPVDAFYRYSEKLSVGLGYRFRYTDVDNNSNTTVTSANNPGDYVDNFISLALNGELFPKLNTNLNVGYQNRSFNSQGLSSDGTVAVLSSFTYAYSPKLNFNIGFNRDFGTAAIGQSTINTGGFIGATYKVSEFVSANARFSMINSDYQGVTIQGVERNDDTIRSSLSLTYTPNVYLSFAATYSYIDNASNIAASSFMGHTVDLSASLRY